MRMSSLISQTLREVPSEADVASHQLLLRAGYIRSLAAGVFSYLPLALRSMGKIESIMRQEMDGIGGQEIRMPVVHPADIWKESGRWYEIDAEMGRFKDRSGRDMVLAMTHEENVADLVRKEIRSYRQLPRLIYHIQTKWRDDPRPRAGLIRAREFTMLDSYSLDSEWEGLDRQYRAHQQAYFNIFRRCGLAPLAVSADVGMMGGTLAHEFMAQTPIGEDSLLLCDACDYRANRQVARFGKQALPEEQPLKLESVATPGAKTIEALADFLGVPQAKTAKAVFMIASIQDGKEEKQRFVFAIVRGDMEVNETKLANALQAKGLRPATEEEIKAVGAEPGYASPVGLLKSAGSDSSFLVIVDELVPQSANLVAGANRAGYHLRNVNYGRDFKADLVADITAARHGDACPRCGSPLRMARGVEVGNIFKLGTRFSQAQGCTFQDGEGGEKPVIMGSYGIGIGRLLATIAELHHDQAGLVWPVTVAPFQVHLVVLPGKARDAGILDQAEQLYQELGARGLEVLYDDREESPGVKFNDADLIGIPLRLTVSERSTRNGSAEVKLRNQSERFTVPLETACGQAAEIIVQLHQAIQATLTPVPYQEL